MKQPIFLQAVTFLAAGLLSFTVEAADFVEGYQEATPDAGITVWEIPDSLLGRDFSLFVTIIDTDFKPEPEAKFGYPGDRFGPMILNFERDGDDLVLLQKTASDICGQAKGPSGHV